MFKFHLLTSFPSAYNQFEMFAVYLFKSIILFFQLKNKCLFLHKTFVTNELFLDISIINHGNIIWLKKNKVTQRKN